MFLADLVRHLSLPLRLDFIGVSSYGAGTESGELVFTKQLRLDVRGRDVLVVDDILDTGRTLKRVIAILRKHKPRRLKVCVLLEKKERRTEKVRADYVGFQIPDLFVVGYGLDYAESYRNLPFVGVLRPEAYAKKIPESLRSKLKFHDVGHRAFLFLLQRADGLHANEGRGRARQHHRRVTAKTFCAFPETRRDAELNAHRCRSRLPAEELRVEGRR